MSEETGLYDKLTIGGEQFRRWQTTKSLEVYQDGKWTSIPYAAQRAIDAAIAAEREACAKIAADWAEKMGFSLKACECIAKEIRARGETKA